MAYNKTEKPDFPAKRKGGIYIVLFLHNVTDIVFR